MTAPISPSWPELLAKLMRREDLTPAEASGALAAVLRGEVDDAALAAFAVTLRAKGETPAELAAMVGTMLEFAERVTFDGTLLDTCGTGGDRSGTLNVSTLSALVAAGAGATVAKHGNRAASSNCGSADVLEALGVEIELGPEGVEACLREAGIGFCFARRFHPAMRYAGPVRAALKVPTTFNYLGPLSNPAGAQRRVMGVSDPTMATPMIGALAELGIERAMVFYGHDGLDELTTTTTSTILELVDGSVATRDLDPADLGLARADRASLAGGDAARNAEIALRVLDGEHGAARDIVGLNAAAALTTAGLADDLAGGLELAFSTLDEGRAAERLEALVKASVRARQDG